MKMILDALSAFWASVEMHAPLIFLVLGILLGGLVVASILRVFVRWFARRSGLETLAEKAGISKFLYAIGIRKGLAQLLGSLVFWGTGLLTLSMVAEVTELESVASMVASALAFLPRLLVAGCVILGGFWVATVLQGLILRIGERKKSLDSPGGVAKAAYYATLGLTFMTAAEQAGAQTELLSNLVVVVVTVLLLGVALAFGLGARTMFQSMVARHQYQGLLFPGAKIAVAGYEGTVVRYTKVAVLLRTETGEVLVPCKELLDNPVGLWTTNED